MSSSFSGGSSVRGSAALGTDMSLEGNVPANVIIRAGKNLREDMDPTEEFLLPAGEKRVVMKCDKNDPTTAVFTFNRDGQTLGGLLVSALLALPCVTFAAYKVPHPLFFVFELRLSTDGAMSPKEALLEASKNMVEDLVMLGRRFTHEWELLKQAEMIDGGGNGDSEMPERATYTSTFSSAGEAANRGRSSQSRERSQQDTRYQFGAGSPVYRGHMSPARMGYRGVGGSEAGFHASRVSGQQARSPDRMSHQGGVKAGSPREDPYLASAAVPTQSVNQSFWGNDELERRTDSQAGGYQGYGAQGLGGSGYQLGGQQASTAQSGGDWTSEYQRVNNPGFSHPGREVGGGYYAGGQQATTIQGSDWTPEYQPLTGQGSGYQNHPRSPSRGYHQPHSNAQAGETRATDPQATGYQGWGQHHRPREGADAPNDVTMEDNDW